MYIYGLDFSSILNFNLISLVTSIGRFTLSASIILYLLSSTFSAFAQVQFKNKPTVKNHSTSKIASPTSYSGKVLKDNSLFFANLKGLLKFDGSNWRLIKTNENEAVLSVLYTDSVIYVAGIKEFGYLKSNENEEFGYFSLNSNISSDIVTDQFFQILSYKGDIYYQTTGHIFRWDGEKLYDIPIEQAYIFKVKNTLYASSYEGLASIRNDSIIYLNKSSKMHDDGAYNIFESSNQNKLTIFTAYDGLFKFNILNNSILPIENEVSNLFKKEGFYYATDYLDSLWVATTSDGSIVIFNEKGKIIKQLDKSVGITGLYLRELVIDNRNKIWVTSDVGISEIYWPEFDTLTFVESKINSIEIEGNIYTSYTYPDSILYDNSDFKISFSAPGFNQDEVQYSYKLDGLNDEWSKWSSNNTKEYTNLNGGNYLFRVKCKTFNGLESKDISIALIINTPWYKTIWAYLGYVLVSLGLVGLITWLRTIQLRISNKRLESLVAKRTDEIQAKSEELAVTNEDLNVKNQELDHFVYRSSHDLIAPLKSLKGLINLAKSDDPQKNQLEYLKHMETSVLKLEDFINNIIDFTTNAKTKAAKVEIKLDDILNDISQELMYFDKAEKVALVRKLEVPVIISDPKRLKIILSNLISNSIKYHNYRQVKPFVEVKSYSEGNQLLIEVKDNGQGIKPEFLNNIFDMFYRASESSEGSGLGLYIVKDTVAKINGELNVESTYGKGSVFTLSLPN